jgi:hypothetical protein
VALLPTGVLTLIHRSVWSKYSANFAFTEFYEVRPFDRMQLPSVRAMVRMSYI